MEILIVVGIVVALWVGAKIHLLMAAITVIVFVQVFLVLGVIRKGEVGAKAKLVLITCMVALVVIWATLIIDQTGMR